MNIIPKLDVELNRPKIRVGIVYHYFANYRESILRKLMEQSKIGIEYWMISDRQSNTPSIRVIPENYSSQSVENCGLRWCFVKNIWGPLNVLWQKNLFSLVKSPMFDAFIFLGDPHFLSTWICAFYAKLVNKKVYMWTHGLLKSKSIPHKFIYSNMFRLADGLFLYGNISRNNLIKCGISANRIYVVFNSLNHDKQVEVRKSITSNLILDLKRKLFPSFSDPVILWVGRLVVSKRIDLLIQAIKRMLCNGLPVNLLIVGDGPDEERLRLIASDLPLGRVCFYGPTFDENILGPLIAMSSLLVSPGSVGLSCVHSLAYGTPCITHDNYQIQGPEFEAIVPGKTGDLYKWNTPNDLFEKMANWINLKIDRRLVESNCQKLVDMYYCPDYQVGVFNSALYGVPASKSFDLDEMRSNFPHIQIQA